MKKDFDTQLAASAKTLLRRRQLLKMLVASAAAGWLPGCGKSSSPMSAPSAAASVTNTNAVIIVGAGMTGLTAANALQNGGMKTLVLEGRDRIGGRLHTVDVGGSKIDLGGSWIHDPIGNPLTDFATQAQILTTPADPQFDLATLTIYDSVSQARLLPHEYAQAVIDNLDFSNRQTELLAALGPGASLKDAIQLYLDLYQPSGDVRRRSEFTLRLFTETFESGPWEIIDFDNFVNGPPNPYSGSEIGDFPMGGYSGLINALANGVPMDIRLQQRVTRIEYSEAGVAIDVLDESGPVAVPHRFTGSHALVTLPLGILKAGSVQFSPPLPAAKQRAIDRVGFGTFEKIAMRFTQPFWEISLGTHLVYINNADAVEWPLFLDLQRFSATPALVGLCTARFAESLLGKSDAEIRARVLTILQQVYGAAALEPTHVTISRWRADEFTGGSYTYLPLGSSHADLDTLAQPVGSRLLFAGEHSSSVRFGYADGSFSTGEREAKRLLGAESVTITAG